MQLSSIKYIHFVVQSPPPSFSKTLFILQNRNHWPCLPACDSPSCYLLPGQWDRLKDRVLCLQVEVLVLSLLPAEPALGLGFAPLWTVSSQICMSKPYLPVWWYQEGDAGRWWGHDVEPSRRACLPPLLRAMWGHEKLAICRRAITWACWHPHRGLPASRTMSYKLLLFTRYQIYDIWWKQPELRYP